MREAERVFVCLILCLPLACWTASQNLHTSPSSQGLFLLTHKMIHSRVHYPGHLEEKQLFFRLLSVVWLEFCFLLIFTFKVQRHQHLYGHVLNGFFTVFLNVTSNDKCDIYLNLQCFDGPAQPRAFYNRLCIYVKCFTLV